MHVYYCFTEPKVFVVGIQNSLYSVIIHTERKGSACQSSRRKLFCLAGPRPGPTYPGLCFPATARHKERQQRQW